MNEGHQVAIVTCGPWQTTFISSTGQLFTLGDGINALLFCQLIRSQGIQKYLFQFYASNLERKISNNKLSFLSLTIKIVKKQISNSRSYTVNREVNFAYK